MSDLQVTDLQPPRQVGLHTISRERDLNIITLRGPLSLEEAKVYHAMVEASLAQYCSAYVMVELTEGVSLGPETRRWIADWNQRHQVNGVAIYGGSLVMRAMLTLLLNAIALLRRQRVPSVFVKTESDARAWLAALPRRSS